MLVWLNERGTKTRKSEENGHRRPFSPKAYATYTERCPVHFYMLFRSHRPEEMNKPDAPFYLAARHGDCRKNPQVWYMEAAVDEASIQRKG